MCDLKGPGFHAKARWNSECVRPDEMIGHYQKHNCLLVLPTNVSQAKGDSQKDHASKQMTSE